MSGQRLSFYGVDLHCLRCGGFCLRVSIPVGYTAVPLIQVSRSEQDGLTYARCLDTRCRAWTRYEIVAMEPDGQIQASPLRSAA